MNSIRRLRTLCYGMIIIVGMLIFVAVAGNFINKSQERIMSVNRVQQVVKH